jgi:pullulanase/glycogen debranching enzyme
VNFALFSRHASRVRLELFDHLEDASPTRIIDLDSARNRTSDVWHVWLARIGPGQLYAYRMDGRGLAALTATGSQEHSLPKNIVLRSCAVNPVGAARLESET